MIDKETLGFPQNIKKPGNSYQLTGRKNKLSNPHTKTLSKWVISCPVLEESYTVQLGKTMSIEESWAEA